MWSSDRTGIPNLFSYGLSDGGANAATGGAPEVRQGAAEARERAPEVRQVTNVLGGASHPSVDPAGQWIYFSSYHADGWHVERIPFSPAEWFAPQPTSDRFDAAPEERAAGDAVETEVAEVEAAEAGVAEAETVAAEAPEATPRRGYRAFGTLRPYYWTPLFEAREQGSDQSGATRTVLRESVGIATGGTDLVGRHSYNLSGRVAVDGSRFAGRFGYSYRGLGNPVLGLSLSQSHDASSRTLAVRFPDETTREYFLVERERAATLSTSFLRRRYRSSTALTLSGGLVQEHLTLQDPAGQAGPELSNPPPLTTFTQFRATLSASNAQRRALSISREDGVRGYVSARVRRENGLEADSRNVAGMDRGFREVTGELSAFKSIGKFGFANHVLALRFSGGVGFGAGANQFHFDIGGAEGTPEPITGLGLFGGSSRLFPVRGYRGNFRSGRIAWTSSAEYRFPIAVLDRGLPFAPLFFDRIHGSVFFDAGNAWGPTLGQRNYDNPRGRRRR